MGKGLPLFQFFFCMIAGSLYRFQSIIRINTLFKFIKEDFTASCWDAASHFSGMTS